MFQKNMQKKGWKYYFKKSFKKKGRNEKNVGAVFEKKTHFGNILKEWQKSNLFQKFQINSNLKPTRNRRDHLKQSRSKYT